jgi:hypothetical protein
MAMLIGMEPLVLLALGGSGLLSLTSQEQEEGLDVFLHKGTSNRIHGSIFEHVLINKYVYITTNHSEAKRDVEY